MAAVERDDGDNNGRSGDDNGVVLAVDRDQRRLATLVARAAAAGAGDVSLSRRAR